MEDLKIFVNLAQCGIMQIVYNVNSEVAEMHLKDVVDECVIKSADFDAIVMLYTRNVLTEDDALDFKVTYKVIFNLNKRTKENFKTKTALKKYAEKNKARLLDNTPAIRCTSLLISEIIGVNSGSPIITQPKFIEKNEN